MNKITLAKICGGSSIGISLITTLAGLISILFPLGDFGVELTSNLGFTIMFGLLFACVTALAISLLGYYFVGAIGSNPFSIFMNYSIICVLCFGLFLLFLKLLLKEALSNSLNILIPAILLLIFLSPIFFTIVALIVKKVSVWKRLLPVISLVLSISIPIIFGVISFLIGDSLGKDSIIYQATAKATIPQWLSLGTIAWILVGFIPFTKNNTEALPTKLEIQ